MTRTFVDPRSHAALAAMLVSTACGPAPASSDASLDAASIDAATLDAATIDAPSIDAAIPLPDAPRMWGAPITLPAAQREQWVWIPMDTMHCADGSAGGFAVDFTDASRDLLFYLQGGGICFDAQTCAGSGAARNVGDDPIQTALDADVRDHHGVFDRSDPDNPFRDSNFVVLPHCTGDHHLGAHVTTYDDGTVIHHEGYANVTRAIERVVPTFADGGRIVLSGFSAGGVGISGNYHQIADAFALVGAPAPTLIIDSGPFMRPPYLTAETRETLRSVWALDETIGTFCPSCTSEGFHEVYRVNATLHPGLRASLVIAYGDVVVRLLYGVLDRAHTFDATRERAGLVDLADWIETLDASIAPSVHHVFYYEDTVHGALARPLATTPGLTAFLNGQLGSGPWASVRP